MAQKLQNVHIRVNDAATGKPTPVRIRITDADGNYYAPFGRLAEFATGPNQDVGGNVLLGMKPHAYIDGTCEIALPSGPIHVQIQKGPEYLPLDLEVNLAPGKMAMRFILQRWANLRQDGWHSGDTRAHFLSPHGALLEAAAEDLDVVNLLVRECQVRDSFQKDHVALPNLLAFSGQHAALEKDGHMVVVNTLNSHPELGSLGLLNCHRIVFPLSFGEQAGWDNWSLAAWCDQCHRKNGLVVWTQTWHEGRDFDYGEPLADLILGKVDAFEMTFFEDSPFDVLPHWYDLLNAGLRVPLVGASGKDGNGIALGSMRTYARLLPREDHAYQTWIEAVRAGRTFVTNGPLLSFQVDGQDPGATVELSSAGHVRVHVEGRSHVPFEHLELIANGKIVASAQADGSPASACLDLDLPVAESVWLAARCRGQQQLFHRPANQRVFAHTSPVYVRVAGQAFKADARVVEKVAGHLESMLAWVHGKARFETNQQRDHLAGIFQQALELLRRRVVVN